MLYVFYGTDTHKVADQTNKLVASLRTKRPDMQVYVFEGDLADIGSVDALVEARGLFVEKHVVVLKGVCENAESRERVFARLPQFATSENTFILSEGVVHTAHKKILATHASKIEEHARPAVPRPDFDRFRLVDSLKVRNRRALWIGVVRAQHTGEQAESLCGLLHWAVRDMLQHPGRYQHVYGRANLVAMSRDLITMYHKAHQGAYDLNGALERWALSI